MFFPLNIFLLLYLLYFLDPLSTVHFNTLLLACFALALRYGMIVTCEFVCVCLFFFSFQYECEFCPPHCSLHFRACFRSVCVSCVRKRGVYYGSLSFTMPLFSRTWLLRLQKSVIPFFCGGGLLFKFTFDTIFKFDLTFFCFVLFGLMAEFVETLDF